MRYELRQFTDSTHTDYIVRATSDQEDVLSAFLDTKRHTFPSQEWYRFHIVDTEPSNV